MRRSGSCDKRRWISVSSASIERIRLCMSLRIALTPVSLNCQLNGPPAVMHTHPLPLPLSLSFKLSLPSLLRLPLLFPSASLRLDEPVVALRAPRSLPSRLLRLSRSLSASSSGVR